MALGKRIKAIITKALYWRIICLALAASCVILAGIVWFSASTETNEAMRSGQRLLITLSTGEITGTQTFQESHIDDDDAPPSTDVHVKQAPDGAGSPASSETTSAATPDAAVPAEEVQPAFPEPDPTEPPRVATVPLAPIDEKLTAKSDTGLLLPVIGPENRKSWQHYAKPYTPPNNLPMVAFVITGLGQNRYVTNMAINQLPENITLSFSPYSKSLSAWLAAARSAGHEVMFDLPVQPSNYPASDPGPYGLLVDKGNEENTRRLEWLMARGQGYIGFLTPQNDNFTPSSDAFRALTGIFAKRGLMIMLGLPPAKQETKDILSIGKIPNAIGDVLVDEELSVSAIQAHLALLKKKALKNGYAIGVAQPLPLTLQQMNLWLAQLEKEGLQLVPVSHIVKTTAGN